ncbi:signal recognition particle protein [Candidatus Enterovibrio escicola]|nr:signal recognition particle protein [Candidatus Enterovibrio escacola]
MFENLTDRLSRTLNNIRNRGRLTEDNIKDTLREVRMALLEADVALPVVREVVKRIKESSVGLEISKNLTPGQEFIKIVQFELEVLMGESNAELDLTSQPPAVILMAGLQGVGKTTSVGKLGKMLKERHKKKVLVVSVDVYRPAAIKQLEMLATEVGIDFFSSSVDQNPIDIANAALAHGKLKFYDVVIVDTAGRLHVDATMMDEIRHIHAAINPTETLFVVDAMTGQDAANTAKAFNDVLPLTGVILTKVDGDARGGAALSVRYLTGKPIKFLGVGEKIGALEPFYPDRIASRILGMGDVLSLIEDLERNVNKDKSEQLAKKFKEKKSFDLQDYHNQLQQMKNMGGIIGMLEKLPSLSNLSNDVKNQVNDKLIVQVEAIINSMTPKERIRPDLLKVSRKKRIAAGSGTQVQDINRLLKQFNQMQKIMKKMQKGGMKNMIRNMKNMVDSGGKMFPR